MKQHKCNGHRPRTRTTKARQPTPRKKHEPCVTFRPPDANQEQIASDLKEMGFTNTTIRDMVSRKDHSVETTLDRSYLAAMNRQIKPRETNNGEKSNSNPKRQSGVKDLVLGGNPNWVLYDCQDTWPTRTMVDPQGKATFERFARYEPGNSRIVEYNIKSGNFRLRSTPDILRTRSVEYTKFGPKLLDLLELKPVRVKLHSMKRVREGQRGNGMITESGPAIEGKDENIEPIVETKVEDIKPAIAEKAANIASAVELKATTFVKVEQLKRKRHTPSSSRLETRGSPNRSRNSSEDEILK